MLEDFIARLSHGGVDRTDGPHGWVTAPIVVRGDGTWMPDSLPVSIAKLVTRTR